MQKNPMTAEQQATLTVKKMALRLDLTDAQQRKLKPIITQQITERRAQMEKMRKLREEKKQLEAEARYERQNEMLDKKLAFKKEMKSILNAEQYQEFEKMTQAREKKRKQRMAKMMKKRRFEEKRRIEEDDN